MLVADCVAYSVGDFHRKFIKDKTLAIACPKLDSNLESYVSKITAMIDQSNINSLTILRMEVPCCGGLVQIARTAVSDAGRNVELKEMVIGIKGDILSENII